MAFNKTSYAVGDVIIFTVSYEAKYWAGVWMPGKSYPVIRTTNTDTPEKKYGEQQHSWLFNGKTLTIAMKALKVGTVSCTLSVYSDDKYSVLEVAGTIATNVVTPPKTTISASASPATIKFGSPSTLTWTTTNANTVNINNGLNSNGKLAGNLVVKPTATTTYTFVAVGAGGTVTTTVTVTVKK